MCLESYVTGPAWQAIMALAGCIITSPDLTGVYTHLRFHLSLPEGSPADGMEQLVDHLFPWLRAFGEQVDRGGEVYSSWVMRKMGCFGGTRTSSHAAAKRDCLLYT